MASSSMSQVNFQSLWKKRVLWPMIAMSNYIGASRLVILL